MRCIHLDDKMVKVTGLTHYDRRRHMIGKSLVPVRAFQLQAITEIKANDHYFECFEEIDLT